MVVVTGTTPALAGLPRAGVLVTGRSLGGIHLGSTRAEVKAAWGSSYGRCGSCFFETWYFTYRRFRPQGAAVVFHRGRVTGIYTVWQPVGWRTTGGLVLGADEAEVTRFEGALPRKQCSEYAALVLKGSSADTVFYLYNGVLWGFGLTLPGSSPCPS